MSKKSRVFFTADHHFGHQNIIKYCHRPFTSVDEMDEALINGWNKEVGKEDDVYHLGDFTFKGAKGTQQYFSQLNGKIHVLAGDHDKRWFPKVTGKSDYSSASGAPVEILPPIFKLEFDLGEARPLTVVLCHYAMRTWPRAHYGAFHLYGHSHGRLPELGRSMDVGVDAVGNAPISFDEVLKLLGVRPAPLNKS